MWQGSSLSLLEASSLKTRSMQVLDSKQNGVFSGQPVDFRIHSKLCMFLKFGFKICISHVFLSVQNILSQCDLHDLLDEILLIQKFKSNYTHY